MINVRILKYSAALAGAAVMLGLASLGVRAVEPAPQKTDATKTEAAAQSPAAPVEQSGPKITVQQHGDWLMECYDPAINNVNCQIKQRVVQKDSNNNILVMSLAYDPKEKTNVIQYVLPLDFLLTPGVAVEIEKYQTTAVVNRCSAQGCFVEGSADEAFIKALKESKAGGRVVLVSRTGQKIGINFSGLGFAKAYDEMKKENTTRQGASSN